MIARIIVASICILFNALLFQALLLSRIMPRLDLSTRRRVLALRQLGYSYHSIKERLEQEDIIVTRRSLERLGKKFCDKGTFKVALKQ